MLLVCSNFQAVSILSSQQWYQKASAPIYDLQVSMTFPKSVRTLKRLTNNWTFYAVCEGKPTMLSLLWYFLQRLCDRKEHVQLWCSISHLDSCTCQVDEKRTIWVIPVNANQLSNNQHNEMVSLSLFVAQQMYLSISCNASVWAWLSSCVHSVCVCVCVKNKIKIFYYLRLMFDFRKEILVQKSREIWVLKWNATTFELPLLSLCCYLE